MDAHQKETPIHRTQGQVLDVDDDTYVAMLWHAGAKDGTDLFAAVWRKREDVGWQARIRFRYDAGTRDPFDGNDEKRCYAMVLYGREEEATAQMRGLWQQILSDAPSPLLSNEEIPVGEWGADALKILDSKPWSHAQEVEEIPVNTRQPKDESPS